MFYLGKFSNLEKFGIYFSKKDIILTTKFAYFKTKYWQVIPGSNTIKIVLPSRMEQKLFANQEQANNWARWRPRYGPGFGMNRALIDLCWKGNDYVEHNNEVSNWEYCMSWLPAITHGHIAHFVLSMGPHLNLRRWWYSAVLTVAEISNYFPPDVDIGADEHNLSTRPLIRECDPLRLPDISWTRTTTDGTTFVNAADVQESWFVPLNCRNLSVTVQFDSRTAGGHPLSHPLRYTAAERQKCRMNSLLLTLT